MMDVCVVLWPGVQLLSFMFEGLCVTHQVNSTVALIRKLQYLQKNHNILHGGK